MPIADMSPYPEGHFSRVYEFIIKPACEKAGFRPLRADDVQKTNFIMLDILKCVVKSPMMIVDLSGRNPNVLYELGVRQAFDLPVTLIKDESTNRIFDIQGIRDIVYNESLRIDSVNKAVSALSRIIRNTYDSHINKKGDVNSIVSLLSVEPAQLPQQMQVTGDTSLILRSLGDIGRRLSRIESDLTYQGPTTEFDPGDSVIHSKFGIGEIVSVNGSGDREEVMVKFQQAGVKKMLVKFANLEHFVPETDIDDFPPEEEDPPF